MLFRSGARITDLPTSVAVPRFAAVPVEGGVRIEWTVGDATGISGFRVQRADAGSDEFEAIATVAVAGTGTYDRFDGTARPGGRYRYRLEVQRGATSQWEGPVEVELPGAIARLAFERLGPNPFDQALGFALAVPARAELAVRVYDVAGHEVRTLHQGELAPGRHPFLWDGRDRQGRAVAAGVYLIRAHGPALEVARRVVCVR